MSFPATPPHYGEGVEGWRAMLAPLTQDERLLARHLGGGAFEVARTWRAYAVQCAVGAERDGVWGDETERLVRVFQGAHQLDVDGIVGGETQKAILNEAADRADRLHDLKLGTSFGFAVFEGAAILAATNWYTPPGGRPGVDCGPAQWRQIGPPFVRDGLKGAFDPWDALLETARVLRDRMRTFAERDRRAAAADPRREPLSARSIKEVAVLAHNWPAGADQIIRNGRLSTPHALATWTKKPGGGHYTHREWRHEYPEKILSFT